MVVKKKIVQSASRIESSQVCSRRSSAINAEVQLFDIWITKKLLASHLGVSISFVNKYMKEGLPFRRRGRAVRFRVNEVEEWLHRRFTQ